jgi:Peptidase family M1 domain
MKIYLWAAFLMLPIMIKGQSWQGKFEQLGNLLPSPNSYRTASGQPGHKYWQQQADYVIKVSLDEEKLVLSGEEEILFHNNSPHALKYLWFQLDQNIRKKNSLQFQTNTNYISGDMEAQEMMAITDNYFYEGGYKLGDITTVNNVSLSYIINETMMRVDLPEILNPGSEVVIKINWSYNLYDRQKIDGRGGYEYFPDDDNYLFSIAQWYPRIAVYDDVEGWQNKQFLGAGEFALTFGDFDVHITVPADHIVAATGELQNKEEVLTKDQVARFQRALKSRSPILIVTEKEARKKEKTKSTKFKTWHFKANNVRDFAFASSRKFIWDAMVVPLASSSPLAMSFYSKEGNPLWGKYSTQAVANTLKNYSLHTFDYPYPVAISVHTADQGMEYPMICFNYGRPNKNGKFSQYKLQSMISVIVHEVGHNFFPMIVNTDERQWTWMDEGINTFLEHLTMDEYYPEFNLTSGTPKSITNYMRGNPDYIRPLMTNSEQIVQFGYNGYSKPSAALSILREVVMGKELFDYAFREYANRWAFKRPMPADFFNTMEDASAIDLDWFWRGWFFTTEYVDISIKDVDWYLIADNFSIGSENDPSETTEKVTNKLLSSPTPLYIAQPHNEAIGEFRNRLDDELILSLNSGKMLYEVTFENLGGLVSPLIIKWTFADGSTEMESIPAEIWRLSENITTKVFAKDKQVVQLELDPEEKTGDAYRFNNSFPRKLESSRFEKYLNKD